jgi:hypothetical protein
LLFASPRSIAEVEQLNVSLCVFVTARMSLAGVLFGRFGDYLVLFKRCQVKLARDSLRGSLIDKWGFKMAKTGRTVRVKAYTRRVHTRKGLRTIRVKAFSRSARRKKR